ncbi:MAG: protein kinase [Isosphaeraceae bacterium]|nr:protein kinase [Isosphaeraceae bacterium]
MSIVLRVTAGPHQGDEYVFDRHDTFVVGRSPLVHFPVPEDRWLSRDHFLIEFNPPLCYLKDMGSTNGTKVNGHRVAEAWLHDGDVIAAGKSEFVVQVLDTASGLPRLRCRGCDREAPPDVAVAARPEDAGPIAWLCDACIRHRRRYPTPPNGFWIEERIGSGGMGEVYRARHLLTGRLVAIKMMIPTVAASDGARRRFRREMEVLKDLRHPNIVAFYGMHEEDGQFSLIMEYVDGRNARQWVEALREPLPVATAARIGVQLLAALEYAHRKGYVHRDIKPSNLLVTGPPERPIVKLSDFGLAKNFRDDAGFTGLTHQGDIGGSVGFLSPDHIRDFREIKGPADLYSAGATLYYLLSGRFPFLDFDPSKPNAYTMILEHPPVPLRAHRPDVPEGLDRVLRKSLEKHPSERWKSAAAMAEALRPFLDERL